MKETGSFMGPGEMGKNPNAYHIAVPNAGTTPSTYSGSDQMSYYNTGVGGQNPGNPYFNQMSSQMSPQMLTQTPPQMPTATIQNSQYMATAPSPWNVNMVGPPIHPGQSPSPGVSYYSATPAPPFVAESSASSSSSPPPMSPGSGAGGSAYTPWANPAAQGSSTSNHSLPVNSMGFATAQQEKVQYSGAHQVSEKSQFSGVPVAASPYVNTSVAASSNTAAEAPKPAANPSHERTNSAGLSEETGPTGLPPPAYTVQ